MGPQKFNPIIVCCQGLPDRKTPLKKRRVRMEAVWSFEGAYITPMGHEQTNIKDHNITFNAKP